MNTVNNVVLLSWMSYYLFRCCIDQIYSLELVELVRVHNEELYIEWADMKELVESAFSILLLRAFSTASHWPLCSSAQFLPIAELPFVISLLAALVLFVLLVVFFLLVLFVLPAFFPLALAAFFLLLLSSVPDVVFLHPLVLLFFLALLSR